MKKNLLLSIFLGAVSAVNAQPTLTGTINPHPGETHTYYKCSYQSPGAAGTNVSWDFSSATATSSTIVQYMDCSGSVSCSPFPGTNLVMNQSAGGQTANMFWTDDNNKQSITGVSMTGANVNYSDPEEFLHFPFSYNNTYTDNFGAVFTNGVTFYRKGTISVTADAYGTLKTPNGTFLGVLRVHRAEHYQDSANYGGTPLVLPYTTDTYIWYSPVLREMLVNIQNVNMSGSTSQSLQYSDIVPTGIAGISNLDATLNMYPNPVQGQLNVKFRLNTAQDLRISVTDIMGKEVGVITEGKFQSGDQHFTYNTSGIAAGMYIVRVQSGENTVVRKIQVQ